MKSPVVIRDLKTLDECRAVVAVQEAVWGADGETVPASLLSVSRKCGGILIGAFVAGGLQPAGDLVGFVFSLAGIRDGAPSQWSHMLGVLPEHRGGRIAERLKLAQRTQAVDAGIKLIEWTFDPLQAPNAHLNLHVLGAVGARYGINVYGALRGPLHRGTPTDRLIMEWWITEPHVARRVWARESDPPARLRRDESSAATARQARLSARSAEVMDAPLVLQCEAQGDWTRGVRVPTDWSARRVLVAVPPRFSEMQQQAPPVALEWRLTMREVMTEGFAHEYRAVDFYLDRDKGGGLYLLAKKT